MTLHNGRLRKEMTNLLNDPTTSGHERLDDAFNFAVGTLLLAKSVLVNVSRSRHDELKLTIERSATLRFKTYGPVWCTKCNR